MTPVAMDGHKAIVFFVADEETGVCSFTWFIEAHGTSFYVKSTMRAMQMVKVSVHGPDPKHIGKQHFRLDFTRPKEALKAINAGAGWAAYGSPLPLVFKGRSVNKRTVHLARFSFEENMFRRGMQRGPDPPVVVKATLHARIAAPPRGKVAHVDLYLSRVRPFWCNTDELEIRAANAGMGPLINDAGMYLTGIVRRRDVATAEPDPFGDVSDGLPADQLIRGAGATVDKTGLLWICEKLISRARLSAVPPPSRPAAND